MRNMRSAPTAPSVYLATPRVSNLALRYLALAKAAQLDLAVAADCGVHLLSSSTAEYPIGMGGIGLKTSHLWQYLGCPLGHIYWATPITTLTPSICPGRTTPWLKGLVALRAVSGISNAARS